MLLNDFKEDLLWMCDNRKTNRAKVAEELGMTRWALYKKVSRPCVAESFVKICEALGYDVEVRYIRREK